jgi:hypothetical protein
LKNFAHSARRVRARVIKYTSFMFFGLKLRSDAAVAGLGAVMDGSDPFNRHVTLEST